MLAQRFDLDGHFDPFDVYRVLRQVNPSPYMYFVRHPEATLVGSSPEPMVQLLDGRVISRPIAGTRRRGRTEADDRRMAAELTEHPKERAEHVMLVDLARNDVGRVVRFGTEQVEELMVLERYSHVMHLTSQVAGELADGRNAVDVLRATFPAGTVSGAPKVRAMEIIDELEPPKRGAYAGVVGYVDFSGNLDTAIAIRTMVWRDGRASVQAGAGHRRRFDRRRRRPGMPQQGAGVAHGSSRGARPRAARIDGNAMNDTEQLEPLRDGAGVVDRPTAASCSSPAPDARSFLQALVSADLDPLQSGSGARRCCSPRRASSTSRSGCSSSATTLWLDTDPGLGAQLAGLAEPVPHPGEGRGRSTGPTSGRMVSLIGPERVRPVDGPVPSELAQPPGGRRAARGRAPSTGSTSSGRARAIDSVSRDVRRRRLDAVGPEVFDAFRIERGIPLQPVDIDDKTIPQEAELEIDAVSFTKGCFLGQELVCRIDSRGHVNRFLRRFQTIDGDWPVRRRRGRRRRQGRRHAHERRRRRRADRRARLRAARGRAAGDRRAALGRRARDRDASRAR